MAMQMSERKRRNGAGFADPDPSGSGDTPNGAITWRAETSDSFNSGPPPADIRAGVARRTAALGASRGGVGVNEFPRQVHGARKNELSGGNGALRV